MVTNAERARIYKASREQKRRRNTQWRYLLTVGALSATLIGAVGSLISIRSDANRHAAQMRAVDASVRLSKQQAAISELSSRLTESERSTAQVQHQLVEAMSHPTASGQRFELTVADRAALESVEKANRDLDKRLGALEDALLQTPEKAVALPLLRQQLSDIQDKAKSDSDSLRAEINHLYGMMQWFLGLMITLIIGVGGLAVNSFRQSGEKHKSYNQDKPGEPGHSTGATGLGTSATSHQQPRPS
jgi:uncharacterized coiled-coil protein SlyX